MKLAENKYLTPGGAFQITKRTVWDIACKAQLIEDIEQFKARMPSAG